MLRLSHPFERVILFTSEMMIAFRFYNNLIRTRMTTFTKTKFKKSNDQRNIDKYRVAANITEYNIVSKLIF